LGLSSIGTFSAPKKEKAPSSFWTPLSSDMLHTIGQHFNQNDYFFTMMIKNMSSIFLIRSPLHPWKDHCLVIPNEAHMRLSLIPLRKTGGGRVF